MVVAQVVVLLLVMASVEAIARRAGVHAVVLDGGHVLGKGPIGGRAESRLLGRLRALSESVMLATTGDAVDPL